MSDAVITFRATDATPAIYRHRDGTTFPIPPDQFILAAGTPGTCCGIPGIMREGLVWEMTGPHPVPPDPGPPWARALKADLEEIKRLLSASDTPTRTT